MGMTMKNPALAAVQNRSRFCEGSMNDRTSAAPPVRFLGPDDLAALEQPVPVRSSQDLSQTTTTTTAAAAARPRKTGSRLFGQVWEGVRGKLRLRRDDHGESKTAAAISAATTTTAVTNVTAVAEEPPIMIYTDPSERDGPPASRTRSKLAPPLPSAPIDIPTASRPATATDFAFAGFQSARPSKDEVLASYQQLMAGGFFQAHAIHASRTCLQGPALATSVPSSSMSMVGMRPATAHQTSPPPQWPLASPHQAQVHSPTSVSSRGTKRAAAVDSDNDSVCGDADDDDEEENNPENGNKENQAPAHHNTLREAFSTQPKKRLRRLASRESIFMPKIRSSSTRRSLSSSHALPPSSSSTGNKLQKRRPSAIHKVLDQQPRPRHVSDGGGSARVLRGKTGEVYASMRVVPDEERGIPSVPAIPAHFTYGEDRQSNGPWRGLRIR